MNRLIITLVVLALVAPFAAAEEEFTPTYGVDWFVSGTQSGTPENAYDNDFGTSWAPAPIAGWWNYTNPSVNTITGIAYYTDGSRGFACHNESGIVSYYNTGGGWNNISMPPTTGYLRCFGQGAIYPKLFEFRYLGTPLQIIADFNATPMNGTAPLYVSFQDISTGETPTSYNWTITPPNGLIGNTTNSEYPTIVFMQPGNYTVNHCAAGATTSDCEEKTNYIWVQNPTTDYVTETFWAVDPLGHRVWNSEIDLYDVGNDSWTNTSSPSGGSATITSLLGNTLNGYAKAAGYYAGEILGVIAGSDTAAIILMQPTNTTNVSAGYVTLYVYAKEKDGNDPIPSAHINLAYKEGGETVNHGSQTNGDGIIQFTVPNQTLIYIYGEKEGYQKVSSTKESGVGSGGSASISEILYFTKDYVTPTVTATTGPGGTVPPTTATVDPYPCDADHPENCERKQTDMANTLISYGPQLLLLFILATIIGTFKMMGK